jgi:hypothetical protein
MHDEDFQRLTLAVLKDYARRNQVAPKQWTLSPRTRTGAYTSLPLDITLGMASAHRIADGQDVFHLLVSAPPHQTTLTLTIGAEVQAPSGNNEWSILPYES